MFSYFLTILQAVVVQGPANCSDQCLLAAGGEFVLILRKIWVWIKNRWQLNDKSFQSQEYNVGFSIPISAEPSVCLSISACEKGTRRQRGHWSGRWAARVSLDSSSRAFLDVESRGQEEARPWRSSLLKPPSVLVSPHQSTSRHTHTHTQ